MSIQPFMLERYFAEYEFKVKYLLSSSDCESLSLEEVLENANPAIRECWDTLRLGYTESQGHPLLRTEVSRLYERIHPGNVLIAAPEELIFIAMQTLLNPGDHIVAISPAYQSLHEIARSNGCQVTPWNVKTGPSGWTLDLAELEQSLTPRTRMLIINFPHNPTGYLPTLSDQEAILDLARRHDLYLFSDEMYRLLEADSAKRLPPVCDLYEKGISLSGLSKTFSLPGLRIGWLATQDHSLLERWVAYHDYTTICNSAPSEILAIMALQKKDWIIHRNLEIVGANLTAAGRFFTSHPDKFNWFLPDAGSVAFPEWKGAGSVEQFCQAALDQQGVMIVPGSLFGFPGNHFRIGLGRKNFPEALEQVGLYLGQP
jgi:aspartate/methionine/tyrosine aminotransferase